MRQINLIVIHCADVPNGRWTTVEDIDAWHQARGFKRDTYARHAFNPNLSAIGYHFVIYTNGGLATGRSVDEIGAHVAGWNRFSIGICLVGVDKFTQAQWNLLAEQVRTLANRYSIPLSHPQWDAQSVRGVCGHNEVPGVTKTCPGFSVKDWLARGLTPSPMQIFPAAA